MDSESRFNRAMVVDDSQMDNLLVKAILKNCKFSKEIVAFESPLEALSYLKKLDSDKDAFQHPEILFLDINMPFMTGFEFIKEMKKLSHPSISKIKILMLSSSDEPEDIAKAKEHKNVIGYLRKPLREEELLKITGRIQTN